eukprot:CAMPEP_0194508242 /NCGR_PEP_ID=MMETSP0253-20130528/38253_1 /TAXON_ID=2966 /ORGANISM="Noctiluca scintillans" /LENGTH=98 /DNA_ID=CAMNT_0039351243 /DNA_START=261 /DNA_END=554 /DNA_ORIENTATION=+
MPQPFNEFVHRAVEVTRLLCVGYLARLLAHSCNDSWVAVSRGHHPDARRRVQVPFTIGGPHFGPLTLFYDKFGETLHSGEDARLRCKGTSARTDAMGR